jgi:hypothetical protein
MSETWAVGIKSFSDGTSKITDGRLSLHFSLPDKRGKWGKGGRGGKKEKRGEEGFLGFRSPNKVLKLPPAVDKYYNLFRKT